MKYTVTGSGIVFSDSFVQMNGYFIMPQFLDYTQTPAAILNELYIEGMAFGFLGIAQSTVSAGTSAPILIKGQDSNQTNVAPGENYEPNGSGGITTNSSGTMVGKNSTSVII